MKLTIELVPRTCWFSNVRSNVPASVWNKLKTKTSFNAMHVCEICGGVGPKWPVECHEIWDYDDVNKIQTLKGLISLCPDCHQVKHIGLAQVMGKLRKATGHLQKVNSLTLEEATNYIVKSFEIWNERSQHEWELDISWLDIDE